MIKRAILYARKSTIDRAAWAGLQSQLDLCRDYAAGNDWQVVGELSEDRVSGAEWMTPEIERALTLAEHGMFDVLVVRQMDRLARDMGKQLFVERQFERVGVEIAYALEQFDQTPEGQLFKLIKGSIAEYERLEIARRMERGRVARVRAGKTLSYGNPPYGYREVDGEFVIHEEEAAVVRQIYHWYVTEPIGGRRQIAERLSEMGVLTARDKSDSGRQKGRPVGNWSQMSVGGILKSETYTGVWRFHTGDEVEVPTIIDRSLWEAAQRQRITNRTLSPRNVKRPYLFRYRARCGRCGRMMMAYYNTRITRGKKYAYRYYACGAYDRNGLPERLCDQPRVRADKVDAAFWRWLAGWVTAEGDGVYDDLLLDRPGVGPNVEIIEAELERLAERDAALNAELQKVLRLHLRGTWSFDLLEAERESIEQQQATIARRQEELRALIADLSSYDVPDLAELRERLKDSVRDARDFKRRRAAVIKFGFNVVLSGYRESSTIQANVGDVPLVLLENFY